MNTKLSGPPLAKMISCEEYKTVLHSLVQRTGNHTWIQGTSSVCVCLCECVRVCWWVQAGLGGSAHLTLLVSIRQQLQTVSGDGEELGVAFL